MATVTVQHLIETNDTTSVYDKPLYVVGDKTQQKPEKHNVQTTLNFFKPNEDGSPPEPAYVNKPQTYDRPRDTRNVTIQDVTGDEAHYSLDSHGFQFVPHVSKEKDFIDDDQIKVQYYKEVDQILKNATGATRTFIFDHTIRRASSPSADQKIGGPIRSPVRQVHIDQSYSAALSRIPFHLPTEAPELLKGRVQLINVWRPIKTIRRDPLGVAASQSVAEEDLVPIGLIYDTRKGETLSVKYSEGQKWFYKYQQTPEEVLLIKCFDNRAGVESKFGEKAKRVPHSAFEVENGGRGGEGEY